MRLIQIFFGLASAVTISDKSSNISTSTLIGIEFEDLLHSGDGGIYGELLPNRAFQGASKPDNYTELPGTAISLTQDEPLSSALPQALKVEGDGFYNSGYWGINVKAGTTYVARFYYKGDAKNFTVALKSINGATVFASTTPSKVNEDTNVWIAQSNGYNLYEAKLTPQKSAPDFDNGLFVSTAGDGGYFGMISLFGDTYKGRENGLRNDLAEVSAGFFPTFLRFPGANNLMGQTPDFEDRWKWNNTIGPLVDRPGRLGDWTYWNTDGLGLHEYFDWVEDMNLEPILGLWGGYSLDGVNSHTGYSVPKDKLGPYIEEVLDELEYITGSTSTKYGALRAANGREEPWHLKYVEIGNEDYFTDTYSYRFPAYYHAIKQKFPQLVPIASGAVGVDFPDEPTLLDIHRYESASQLVDSFSEFDSWPINNTGILLGEYNGGTPTMEVSSSEAVYLIGLERNSNKVRASCYSSFMFNANYSNGAEAFVTFDPGNVWPSTSYYAHKIIASSVGSRILEIEDAEYGPLYYAANINDQNDTIHVHIANPNSESTEFSASVDIRDFEIDSATGEAMTSSSGSSGNVPRSAPEVLPQNISVSHDNQTFSISVGPYFVGAITLKGVKGETSSTSSSSKVSSTTSASSKLSSTALLSPVTTTSSTIGSNMSKVSSSFTRTSSRLSTLTSNNPSTFSGSSFTSENTTRPGTSMTSSISKELTSTEPHTTKPRASLASSTDAETSSRVQSSRNSSTLPTVTSSISMSMSTAAPSSFSTSSKATSVRPSSPFSHVKSISTGQSRSEEPTMSSISSLVGSVLNPSVSGPRTVVGSSVPSATYTSSAMISTVPILSSGIQGWNSTSGSLSGSMTSSTPNFWTGKGSSSTILSSSIFTSSSASREVSSTTTGTTEPGSTDVTFSTVSRESVSTKSAKTESTEITSTGARPAKSSSDTSGKFSTESGISSMSGQSTVIHSSASTKVAAESRKISLPSANGESYTTTGSAVGPSSAPGTTIGTEMTTYTTYCPSPTTFTYQFSTYTVSEPTTLVITQECATSQTKREVSQASAATNATTKADESASLPTTTVPGEFMTASTPFSEETAALSESSIAFANAAAARAIPIKRFIAFVVTITILLY